MSRRCTGCGIVKPLTEFRIIGTRPQSKCRPCEREYQQDHHAANYIPARKTPTEIGPNLIPHWQRFCGIAA